MASPSVQHVLDRLGSLQAMRGQFPDHWQELAEVMLPRRADFQTGLNVGAKRLDKQYDGTPMQAVRGLAAALDSMLKPRTSPWFGLKVMDEELADLDEVRFWLQDSRKRMERVIYDRRARFQQRTGETDLDLVVFGTGVLLVSESRDLSHVVFRALHLKNTFIGENADGEVDTCYYSPPLTARQAAQRFGEDNLGAKTREMLRDERRRNERVHIVEAVEPREDAGPGGKRTEDLPFAHTVVDVESEHRISVGGFHEFPFAVPRWDTMAEEGPYGRSPGMIALPDVQTVHQQGKTLLRAGHKAVDPPLLLPSDGVIEGPRTWPGGNTYYDAEMAARFGRVPIVPLETGAKIPLGREMQNDTRAQIQAAFFLNVLKLPTEGPQMTATEIIERREEFVRTIAPIFGRLESDYVAPVVNRVFGIMLRAGAFLPIPEVLQGRSVEFEFASPVERVRKRVESAASLRTAELLAPYIQFRPEIMDHFDSDEIARDVAEAEGMPQRWILSRDRVQQLRQQRAEAEARERQAAQEAELPRQVKDAGAGIASLAKAGGAQVAQ